MVDCHLYVEGGGSGKSLRIECRMAFTAFLEKAGLRGAMPRIVACGSRYEAYDRFCTALSQGQRAVLLVDSEEPVASEYMVGSSESWRPWAYLKHCQGKAWAQPDSSSDSVCHLMVQVMESWFLADKDTLAAFFGQGFRAGALPSRPIEDVDKDAVFQGLAAATKECKTKGCYGKGAHSFKILAKIAPDAVCGASPWAKRFIDTLREGHF